MKTKPTLWMLAFVTLVLVTINSRFTNARAQGTAFTYQGRLNDGANAANGNYDLSFALYGTNIGSVAIAGPVANSAVGVTNGLFTVTLDFGNQFPGAGRWLEIGVRTNGGGSFFTLSPRQELTPAPYAITAGSVVSGGLASGTYGSAVTFNNAANQFNGSYTGNGANVTNVNAALLGGVAPSNFWQLGGNNVTAGKFLGSTNNQPVEIWANNLRVMQFNYASNASDGYSPNLIGGFAGNLVTNGVVGATIAGGGSFGSSNRVLADFGSVLGGSQNTAKGINSVAMGFGSVASGIGSTAMGDGSIASGSEATAMGILSVASGAASTAMGSSTASGSSSTAAGTSQATNSYSTALGHSIAGGQFSTAMGNSTAIGDYSTAGGGFKNVASGFGATVAGGGSDGVNMAGNSAYAPGSSVGGGVANSAFNSWTTIAGGFANNVYETGGFIGGGNSNNTYATFATVCGGSRNESDGNFSTVCGGSDNVAGGTGAFVGGGGYNDVLYMGNGANGICSAVTGGFGNSAEGNYAAIPGGAFCQANASFSFAAGYYAVASHQGSFVWADDTSATDFTDSADHQFVIRAAGGMGLGTGSPETPLHIADYHGITLGTSATGGGYTALRIDLSAAQNGYAELQAIGQAGSSYGNLILQANGGNVGIGTTTPASKLTVSGNILATGTITGSSDRNVKEHFAPVSARNVLEKVAALPISEWNYKADDATLRHIGPMAQDFYAAFNVGMDDKHISMVDADGVALAAIQGLNEKLNEKEVEIKQLKEKSDKVDSLETRLAELEKMVQSLSAKK